ncbi:MAG: electron transfer flavoprotein subunit beta/FixA family protein [Planctomycetes bacterium]|jgi:electron transfer flavoprotein beta subunit|nr:electron transfer flavoprotein subunit beta/FixA family protein [Planctomycetota bacterium]
MDIVALVKRVPDPEARVSVNAGALEVEPKSVLGLFDEVALEQALRMKAVLGGKVWAVTLGGPTADEVVRKALAMGADRIVRVEPPPGAHDPLVRAAALAGAVRKTGAGVVLCGKQSGDEEAGFTGPAVAALLGLPCVTRVLSLQADAKEGKGRREVEGGTEGFEVAWPAVLTAARKLADPRVPPIMGVMKAMKAPVEVWTAKDVGAEGAATRTDPPAFEAPPRRAVVRMVPGAPDEAARALVKILKEEAKVL